MTKRKEQKKEDFSIANEDVKLSLTLPEEIKKEMNNYKPKNP